MMQPDPRCWQCRFGDAHSDREHWRNLALASIWDVVAVNDVLAVSDTLEALPDTNDVAVYWREHPARPVPDQPAWRYAAWTELFYVTMNEAIRIGVNRIQVQEQTIKALEASAIARTQEVLALERDLTAKKSEADQAQRDVADARAVLATQQDALLAEIAKLAPVTT